MPELDYLTRAKIVKLEVDRLVDEAERAYRNGDHLRIRDIEAEVQVRLDALREIHREQLLALAAPAPKRQPWWTRIFSSREG